MRCESCYDTAPDRPGVDGEALVLLDADVVARRRGAHEVRHGLVVVVADGHLGRLRRLEEHLHALLLEAVELRDDLLGLGFAARNETVAKPSRAALS